MKKYSKKYLQALEKTGQMITVRFRSSDDYQEDFKFIAFDFANDRVMCESEDNLRADIKLEHCEFILNTNPHATSDLRTSPGQASA